MAPNVRFSLPMEGAEAYASASTIQSCEPMPQDQRGDTNVRWIDATTGEDFTDRMYDLRSPPGEGILKLARALARLAAAHDAEAHRRVLVDVQAELQYEESGEHPLPQEPRVGDGVLLCGASYRYEGPSANGEHFTRLKSDTCSEALVSLARGSAAATWMLKHLSPVD